MKTFFRLAYIFLLAVCAVPGSFVSMAQSEGVPIEFDKSAPSQAVLDQAEHLRADGRLLRSDAVAAQLVTPLPGPVRPADVLTRPLRPREVAARARAGGVHVGWYYLCPDCNHWHAKLLGGYAIAWDAVATAYHCVDPDKNRTREGYLIAVDSEEKVRPVTAVLATSKELDAVILRVGGGDLSPLALNGDVAPGDAAFCLSDPLGQNGYFSQGIVNRFLWLHSRGNKPGAMEEWKSLRMNVSTDWAPGSSGAAVLDECGNVIGHVATISPMAEKSRAPSVKPPDNLSGAEAEKNPPPSPVAQDRFNGAVLITLHAAIPARGVLALVRSLNRPAAPETR
ncbi:MAG: serine protease [Verrucomicrobiota bacterium]